MPTTHFPPIRSVLGTLLLMSGLFAIGPVVATAQQSVQPLVIDKTLEQNGKATADITITNPSDRMVRVYATVNAIRVDDAGAIEEFTSRNSVDDTETVTSWLAIERGRIEISPGQSYEATLQIDVHPQATPGVYHGFIGFASGRNRPAAEESVRSGQAPGSIVRIEIAEDRDSYLQLDQFTTNRFVVDSAKTNFDYTISNPGDMPLQPNGEVIVYDSRGREVGAVPANPEQVTIAPGEEALFSAALPETDGLGRYRAYLALTYGEGRRATLQDTIYFFRLPLYHLIALFTGILLISIGVAYWLHRRYGTVADDFDGGEHVNLYHDPEGRSEPMGHDLDLRPMPPGSNDETYEDTRS